MNMRGFEGGGNFDPEEWAAAIGKQVVSFVREHIFTPESPNPGGGGSEITAPSEGDGGMPPEPPSPTIAERLRHTWLD